MNDYEYVFIQDGVDKKATGRGAAYKVRKSKRCSLPSDNLTPAELRKKNSAVITWDLSKPMSWSRFKAMPLDLQTEYIRKIVANFGVTLQTISTELWGLCKATLSGHVNRNGLNVPRCSGKRDNEVYVEQFRRWINGEISFCTDTVSEEPEDHFAIDAENISVGVIAAPATRFPLKTATLQMEGDADELVQALQLFLCGRSAELEISINFKEEN